MLRIFKSIGRYKHFLQIAISVILFFVLLSYLNMKEAQEVFFNVNLQYIIAVYIIYMLDRLLMAWKWTLLLNVVKIRLDFLNIFKIYYISSFLGFTIPFGVGPDIIRYMKIKKRVHPGENALVSIVVERFLGLVATAIMVLISLVLFLMYLTGSDIRTNFLYFLSTLIVGLSAILSFIFHDTIRTRILKFAKIKPLVVKSRLEKYYFALAKYKDQKPALFYFLIFSFIEQLMPVLAVYFAAKSIAIPLSFVNCLAFVPLSIFLERLPVSFLGIGLREGSYIFLLRFMGVDYTNAFLLSIIMFIMDILTLIPAAIWSLFSSWKTA